MSKELLKIDIKIAQWGRDALNKKQFLAGQKLR
jgi:hypothetical protein